MTKKSNTESRIRNYKKEWNRNYKIEKYLKLKILDSFNSQLDTTEGLMEDKKYATWKIKIQKDAKYKKECKKHKTQGESLDVFSLLDIKIFYKDNIIRTVQYCRRTGKYTNGTISVQKQTQHIWTLDWW